MKRFKKIVVICCVTLFFPIIATGTLIRRLISKARNKNEIRSILIIDNAKIGDMVCATPVFRAIKEKYPAVYLAVLINPKTEGILKNNPRIDEILCIDSRIGATARMFKQLFFKRYDAVCALVPGTLNYLVPYFLCIPIRSVATAPEYGLYYGILSKITATHRTRFFPRTLSIRHYLRMLMPLGISNENLKKEVYYTPDAYAKTRQFLVEHGWDLQKKLVGFSVTAGNKMKEWSTKKFAEVAQQIYSTHGYIPVFIGSLADRSVIDEVGGQLLDQKVPFIVATTFVLEEVPALISHFSYFISVDTGTLYIANALDIPVVDILGPCSMDDQVPVYEKCEVVYVKDLPGWPYTSVLHSITKLNTEQMKCLSDITSNMVFQGFENLHKKYAK